MRSPRSGATLVELVVVLTITSVLAGGMAVFLTKPLEAYQDLSRRAALVDAAEGALRRIARDVRRALPNSLRVAAGGTALEMLHVAEGIKYRREPGTNPGPPSQDHTPASDWLGFGAGGDDHWNLLGRFQALAFSYGVPLPAGTRVVIYPTGPGIYAEAALGTAPGTITPAGTTVTINPRGDEDQLELSAPFPFRFESPQQRLFLVDTPISYLCDGGAETLTRYAGYGIVQAQPTVPVLAPLSAAASALVSKRLAACTFTWQPGTPQRTGLLTVELSLAEDGEQIRLLHQIHVENAP
jgi:MSHA biogenesis protein MshO